LQHWLTVSNDPDNLHIYMNYHNTTNQPILSTLLLMTCLRLLVLDLLHLVPVNILQLPPGTLYQSISAMWHYRYF